MKTKYKCDNHTMVFSCPSCTQAFFARYDELLAFVKELSDKYILPINFHEDAIEILFLIHKKAQKVLKEIEEL